MVPKSSVKSIWTHGANSEPTCFRFLMVPTPEVSLIGSQQRASDGSSLISDHTFRFCSCLKQCGHALRVSESRMCACCKNLIKRREGHLTSARVGLIA